MNARYLFLFVLGALMWLAACKEDNPVPMSPPDTRLFVDQIDRSGDERLQSLVHLYWSGDDKDGIVVGYEISLDNANWNFVTRTDSVFSFTVTTDSDTADINFWVRAKDNDDLLDPTPAYIKIPIRNTPPEAAFDSTFFALDTHRVVFTLGLSAFDVDGAITLDRVEIKANAGSWLTLPATTSILSLVPDQPEATGQVAASVYTGTDSRNANLKLDGLNLNGPNTFYLRAADQGGLYSIIDTSSSVVLLNKKADWMVFDLWRQSSSFIAGRLRPIALYQSILTSAFGAYDYMDLTDDTKVLPLRLTTLNLLMKLYPKVFLFTNRGDGEVAFVNSFEEAIQNYLTGGGKLLLNVPYAIGTPDPEDPFNTPSFESLFLYSPADSVSSVNINGVIPVEGKLNPDPVSASAYPVLSNGSRLGTSPSGSLITRVNPYYLKAGASAIYRAEVENSIPQTQGPWVASTVVIARLQNQNNKTNIIYSSVPLHEVNGNSNLSVFFEQVAREFQW